MKTASVAFALTVLLVAPANATTVFEQKFTCPIGGEEFKDFVIGSTSSWGQRPDGKAIGGVAPWPVTECPGNGLPLYKDDFTTEELAALALLIASPEFAQMRSEDTSYHRIWWLRSKLGADPYSLVGNLLAASWESDDVPERKAGYQRAFAEAAEALERTDAMADNWFWYSLRAANAWRELGEFGRAAALLGTIDRPELLPQDAKQRDGARFLIDGLTVLIGEQNQYYEPANLVGPEQSIFRCRTQAADMSAVEKSACESREYRKEQEEFARYEAERDAAEAAGDAVAADNEANVEAAAEAVEDAAAETMGAAAEAAAEAAREMAETPKDPGG